MEESLGAKLLTRFGESFTTTQSGQKIYRLTQEIGRNVFDIERSTGQVKAQPKRKVCIATTECMASSWLVSKLPLLSQLYPEIEVEILTGTNNIELLINEADIALCLGGANPEVLRQRKVGLVEFGLYVSNEYLRKFGEPNDIDSLQNHYVIEASRELASLSQVDALRKVTRKSEIAFSTNSVLAQYIAATDGLGIAVLPNYLVDGSLNLQRLLPAEFSVKQELWLQCRHQSMEKSKVRFVWVFLTDSLKQDSQLFCRECE